MSYLIGVGAAGSLVGILFCIFSMGMIVNDMRSLQEEVNVEMEEVKVRRERQTARERERER